MGDAIKDKLLASFIFGVGFWLINLSHIDYAYNFIWGLITATISGLAIITLFIFSIKAISNKEKLLGWTCLLTSISMIISYIYIMGVELILWVWNSFKLF